MLTIIFLLILAYSFIGRPAGKLVSRVKNVNWGQLASESWNSIRTFGLKAGRATCTPLLYFYYVMADGKTTVGDKALIYGAILYVVSPFDILPRKILGLLGVVDDAAVIAFVYKQIKDKISPEIEASVNATLDEWFGTYSPSIY